MRLCCNSIEYSYPGTGNTKPSTPQQGTGLVDVRVGHLFQYATFLE